jgi:hypothetical protein
MYTRESFDQSIKTYFFTDMVGIITLNTMCRINYRQIVCNIYYLYVLLHRSHVNLDAFTIIYMTKLSVYVSKIEFTCQRYFLLVKHLNTNISFLQRSQNLCAILQAEPTLHIVILILNYHFEMPTTNFTTVHVISIVLTHQANNA